MRALEVILLLFRIDKRRFQGTTGINKYISVIKSIKLHTRLHKTI